MNNQPLPSSEVTAIHTYLYPGDMLYIPPYHFIHSEAQGPCDDSNTNSLMSFLDVLSPSLEQLILFEAGFVEAKFGNLEGMPDKVIASQVRHHG